MNIEELEQIIAKHNLDVANEIYEVLDDRKIGTIEQYRKILEIIVNELLTNPL